MGVPSYFSYIIKNHSNIIRNLPFHRKVAKTVFHSLYLDCNSIVYDAVHTLEKEFPVVSEFNDVNFEQKIIERVIAKIREYISIACPTKVVYIAFDGVAPFAKIEQQRSRRYKSAFLSKLDFSNRESPWATGDKPLKWNTAAITPGTPFMKELSRLVRTAFESGIVGIDTVIVSAADEPGEGEHKMFQYIRDNVESTENVAVYGLDSDLIMLSIIHTFLCSNIYIFREAPEFSNSILPSEMKFSQNELLIMNINTLSESILHEMKCLPHEKIRIYDYIFMCFFLGNDFLPNISALNIRRNGIDRLLNLYSIHMKRHPNGNFINKDFEINWDGVNLYLRELAKYERDYLIEEHEYRYKLSKKLMREIDTMDREKLFESSVMCKLEKERYIAPEEEGWEKRYYRMIGEEKEEIVLEYKYGVMWVWKYYNGECEDKGWKYRCGTSPLIKDIAEGKTPRMCKKDSPIRESELCKYVLNERELYGLLQLEKEVKEKVVHETLYKRYIWECHMKITAIS